MNNLIRAMLTAASLSILTINTAAFAQTQDEVDTAFKKQD